MGASYLCGGRSRSKHCAPIVALFRTDYGDVVMTAEEQAAYDLMTSGRTRPLPERFRKPYDMLMRRLEARARRNLLGTA